MVFNVLLAGSTKLTGKSVTLKWKKVSGADGYKVYGNRCGKKVAIAVSKTVHAATTGGKYGAAKPVKVSKSKAILKKGKNPVWGRFVKGKTDFAPSVGEFNWRLINFAVSSKLYIENNGFGERTTRI